MQRFTPDLAERLTRELRITMPGWGFTVNIHNASKATIEAKSEGCSMIISEHLLRRKKKGDNSSDILRIKVKGHYGDLARYISGKSTAPSILLTLEELDSIETAALRIADFAPKLVSFFAPLISKREEIKQSASSRQQLAQEINSASGGKIRTLHDGMYPDLYGNTKAWFLTGEVQGNDRVKIEITVPGRLAVIIANTLGKYHDT